MLKKLLQKVHFPVKLTLIGLIPLLFILFLANELNRQHNEKIAIISQFAYKIEQSGNVFSLVDALQNERRYAFVYAFNKSEQGNMFTKRIETDNAIKKVEASKRLKFKDFKSYTFLNNLHDIRSKTDNGSISAQEVMSYYTNAIFRVNVLTSVSTGAVPALEPLTYDLNGQMLLSEMITYLGLLRGNYHFELHTNQDPKISAAKLKGIYEIFKTFETEFLIKSSRQNIEDYLKIRNGEALRKTIFSFDQLFKNQVFSNELSPEEWWELSIKSLDDLKALHRKITQAVLDKTQAIYDQEQKSRTANLILLITVILFVSLVVFYIIRHISKTLTSLKDVAQKIAVGQTGNNIEIQSNDVIGKLSKSIQLIEENNLALAGAADEIGKGNFDVEVSPRSQMDVLGNALKKMKTDLHSFTKDSQEKIWVQKGLSEINDNIRGEKPISELCQSSLNALSVYLGAEVGLFYVSNGDHLYYLSGYAVYDESLVPQKILFGQTLAGQAARDKHIITLENADSKYLKVGSALGNMQPLNVLIVPLIHNDQVEGVIELAFIKSQSENIKGFLESVSTGIAIALQASKNRERVQELLEETQSQSEELQAQHSELENLNAELEVQMQNLQASEEELKVQQEELQETNNELAERTRLLEEKNAEVNKKAEELALSTKYKSEFLANMSHELRTPLNSILLLSRLLGENNEKNLSRDQVEYAKVIQSSGHGLLGLIDEILDLSKIEAGKMQFEFMNVPVVEITEDLKALFKPVASEKGLEFFVNIQADHSPVIETDKSRVEQILKNLLSNAFKFTSKGSVTLEVKNIDNPNYISFEVIDTGIGIPKDKQPLIFEAFQQADGSTKRKYGGTGLGLSISRELAKLLGGEIKLNSEVDKGSTFRLVIPVRHFDAIGTIEEETLAELVAPKDNVYLSSYVPESIEDDRENYQHGEKSILIVEDDTNFAKLLVDYTRKQGYKAIATVRGDEAVMLAEKYIPRGILLDIQLPIKSGWEIMNELKKSSATKIIPVHIMSSHEVKMESLLKGAVNFINKPMAFEQLPEIFQKIEEVLLKHPKKVLIIEENSKHSKALEYFLESFKIHTEVKNNINESIDTLQNKEVDCVILDMGIPDQKAYEMLEEAKKNPILENMPIIVFTGKSLSLAEEHRIKQYADSIIVKTAHSYKRVLDEISLFLHLVDENNSNPLPNGNQKKLKVLDEILRDKVVMVVDDDVRNIFSLSKTLENLKMKVITAVDGREAIAILEQNSSIDIVLLDMMMPNMDGYETASRIRKNILWKDLPVIAVTAKAMSGDREKCINAGASDYITKPIDIDQLLSLLRVWLYEKK